MPRKSRGPYLAWNAKRGGYYVHINENGSRRELSAGTADRGEAEGFLGQVLAERRQASRTGAPARHDVQIADMLADYLEDCGQEQAQPEIVGWRVTKLLNYWGTRTVGEVTTATVKGYAEFSGVQPGTLRRELGIFRAALNHAVKTERLKDAPFVKLPDAPPGRERWLTRSEAAALLWQARATKSDTRPYLTLFIRLALYTGARPGALKDLRWPQVEFDRGDCGCINFNPPGRARTSKGRAVIPMNAKVRAMMERAKATHGSDLGHVINRAGKPVGDLGNSLASALRRAGISDVTPHTLRHTAGTWLAQKGVPLWQIGGWLGHSDDRTTALYAHHHPDHMKEARAAMSKR
jgi:integrase